MAEDNKGYPAHFLSTFLTKPASSIPKGAQWAVMFDNLDTDILPAIKLAYAFEPGGSNEWKTAEAANAILTPAYQEDMGCMFCQAIAIPGEGSEASVQQNIKQSSYIGSYLGGGRNNFAPMRMTFLDTNISFCDSFLRGWAIATAAFGMIARSGKKNFRTDMTCWKFGITPNGPIILQTISFKGICCISVSEEEYNYLPPTGLVEREAQFVYHSYSIDSSGSASLRS
jgi:hypothetical protein